MEILDYTKNREIENFLTYWFRDDLLYIRYLNPKSIESGKPIFHPEHLDNTHDDDHRHPYKSCEEEYDVSADVPDCVHSRDKEEDSEGDADADSGNAGEGADHSDSGYHTDSHDSNSYDSDSDADSHSSDSENDSDDSSDDSNSGSEDDEDRQSRELSPGAIHERQAELNMLAVYFGLHFPSERLVDLFHARRVERTEQEFEALVDSIRMIEGEEREVTAQDIYVALSNPALVGHGLAVVPLQDEHAAIEVDDVEVHSGDERVNSP